MGLDHLIVQGVGGGKMALFVTDIGAGSYPLGEPTMAPSPLPTGSAPISDQNYFGSPESISIHGLWPHTQYFVTAVWMDWAQNPPSCVAPYLHLMGSFTTGD